MGALAAQAKYYNLRSMLVVPSEVKLIPCSLGNHIAVSPSHVELLLKWDRACGYLLTRREYFPASNLTDACS
jgi:hypothetical protein